MATGRSGRRARNPERQRQEPARPTSSGPAALDLWTRKRPDRRRPRHTLDQLAEAAMHIADTEGVEALSMRRLANEVGAGTMSLYHYVRTKDELLALLTDRVMSELLLADDEFPDTWREAMTAIARRTRDVLLRHAWVFDIAHDPTIGPHGVRHFDQSLRALRPLQLDIEDSLDILHAVDEYVFGYCLQAREAQDLTDDSTDAGGMFEYATELSRTGDYPQIASLLDEYGAEALWRRISSHDRDPERFDRNLARILDGIENDLASVQQPER
jgi:AcrR family transcriptional regulator